MVSVAEMMAKVKGSSLAINPVLHSPVSKSFTAAKPPILVDYRWLCIALLRSPSSPFIHEHALDSLQTGKLDRLAGVRQGR